MGVRAAQEDSKVHRNRGIKNRKTESGNLKEKSQV